MTRFRSVRSPEGAAMVEFALVAGLLFLLIFGIIDFGRALFLYNNLTNAAREGARVGAVDPNNTARVQAVVLSRIQDFTGAPAPSGFTPAVVWGADSVAVTIANFPFTPITPVPQLVGKMMNVSAVFRREDAP